MFLKLIFFLSCFEAAKTRYDSLYEMEMQKAKMNYINRKKMVATGASWEDLQRSSFKGVQISNYYPITHFFLNLYGENFDLYLALHSCTPQQ